jgi:hypothetical protein
VHNDIEDATSSHAVVLYKVFGKIHEWRYWEARVWRSWEASDKKGTFVPLWLALKGTAGTGKSVIINTIVS